MRGRLYPPAFLAILIILPKTKKLRGAHIIILHIFVFFIHNREISLNLLYASRY